jgi:site-specific DNA-methyltransferase (adenine-specific)
MKPYYEHAGITIYHGDCREIVPELGRFDLLLTDPPYGVNLGNHAAAAEKRPQFLSKPGYNSYDDTHDNLREIVVPSIVFALSISERGIVFCAGTMMWDFPRPNAVGGVYLPAACGRNCWGFSSLAHCLYYGAAPDINKGSKHIAISSTESAFDDRHPCSKPLGWMKWLINLGSRPGENVIDPFMGSGTTLRAAKDLGRNCVGIDIEERYCEIAANRMQQEVIQFGEDARAGQGECPGIACNSGRDAMPLDIFEGVQ